MGLFSVPPVSQTPPWISASCQHGLDTPSALSHRWTELVGQIQQGEAAAMTDLYRLFLHSVRYALYRQLGSQDLEDMLHDSYLIVVQAIRRGELREPERLMGFVRTIVRRQVAAHIETVVQERCQQSSIDPSAALIAFDCNPEQALILRQREEIAQAALETICERDRQILIRFYLLEQSADEICYDLGLSKTQFRLFKSRAKARFGKIGRRKIRRAAAPSVPLKKSGASAVPG
jgi:RNA polymerase sigma factor (sigma-70 family)